jgi:hypothetical protein
VLNITANTFSNNLLADKWSNLERQILEMVVVQAYQDEVISAGKVRQLLRDLQENRVPFNQAGERRENASSSCSNL